MNVNYTNGEKLIKYFLLILFNNSILILLQITKLNREFDKKNMMIVNLKMIKINRISDAPYGASAILFNFKFLE